MTPDQLWNAALAHHRAGRLDQALVLYDQLILAQDGHFAVRANRGGAYLALGQFEAALADFERAVALEPANPAGFSNRAMALLALGQAQAALDSAAHGLSLDPGHIPSRQAGALALNALGRFAEAVGEFDRVLAAVPQAGDAWLHRGTALYGLGRLQEAAASFEAAAPLLPASDQPLFNLGKALADLDRPEMALAAYDRALALRPGNAEAQLNRGAALEALGRRPDAVAAYQAAVAIDPDYAPAQANLAMTWLALGELEAGFALAEWRKRMPAQFGVRDDLSAPEWRGETPLAGRRLLVHAEQGLGDTIQFARYLRLVLEAGGVPILSCQLPLVSLMRSLGEGIEVVGDDQPPPAHDLKAALLSLPMAFRTDLDSIPAPIPYLAAEADRVAAWRARIGSEGFRIGVAWRSSRLGAAIGKSFALAALAPLADLPGVRLISLQRGEGEEEIDFLPAGLRVETLGADFDSTGGAFLDSAAVMDSLDLVISADTALVHLAGALGRPVWTALKFCADWRWLEGRSDSPWYPTMTLFRQDAPGDWDGVFARMRQAVAKKLG